MLEGMAALVRSNADRGDGVTVIDIGRETEPLVGRVVVITKHPVNRNHLDIVDPGIGKNLTRRPGTRHPARGRDLLVFVEGRGDAELRPQPEGQRDTDQKDVEFKGHGSNVLYSRRHPGREKVQGSVADGEKISRP